MQISECRCEPTSTLGESECACGFVNKPSADGVTSLGKATGFSCPVCDEQPLYVGEINKTQVCFCAECRGFVIDRASFGELVEILRAAYGGADDAPIMLDSEELKKLCLCPACSELMETFSYCGPGNVVLDTCNECQLTWLNEGELGKIMRAPGQRKFRGSTNYESELLRSQLYENSEADFATGMYLLGRLFS